MIYPAITNQILSVTPQPKILLPIFPKFKKLELSDRPIIEEFTSKFPPYSDFNFMSLWAWNNNTYEISSANDNLIIKLSDYSLGNTIYSLIGGDVQETIFTIFQYMSIKKERQIIKLIPEEVVKQNLNLKNHFIITEDTDNFDYILLVDKLASMQGRGLHQKRKQINKFINKFKTKIVIKSITDKNIDDELFNLYSLWQHQSGKGFQAGNEFIAMKRLFIYSDFFEKVQVICIYDGSILIGFSIFEIIDNSYALSSFQKSNRCYLGLTEFMNQQLAQYLLAQGCKYLNIEQDLGLKGLREAKSGYEPIFLKKYTITNDY